MSDRIDDDNALFADDDQRTRWDSLHQLPMTEPDNSLRRRVLGDIRSHSDTETPRWWSWLMPAGPQSLVGLTAMLLIGLTAGLLTGRSGSGLDQRMASMENQLIVVNQQLLLSRLNAASPSERLAAALQASTLGERDTGIATALLRRAATDPVASVRSAAIAALGDEINADSVSMSLLDMLQHSDSPIVQMAIVDLVLRHGNSGLLQTLRERADDQQLHPALAGYISETIGKTQI